MAECECLSGCPFFNDKMKNMPAMADLMKKQYCQGDFESCARYMVFKALGSGKAPIDLFPTDKAQAQKIIQNG